MSRFYVPKEAVKEGKILITGKEAHHILNVMRLKVSDDVVVFDGTGREYAGIVKETGRKSLSVEIISTRNISHGQVRSIILIQSIPKKDKMDYIVEKATELGVNIIMPVMTGRTVPDWNESKRSGMAERWQKITEAAAKQCGRADIPQVLKITSFEEAVSNISANDLRLIAALEDKAVKLKDALKDGSGIKTVIAIGPEGDFTAQEVRMAMDHGFKTVNLGPRVLKSDTAALAALAMINYEYTN